jgi:hypothetical protein
MFDDPGGSLTQNHIDVRLVQNNVYFNGSSLFGMGSNDLSLEA